MTSTSSDANTLPSCHWTALPERGTHASLRLLTWIATRIGRATARIFLYPISFYFVISAHVARRVSYQYLGRIRGRAAHWWHVLCHFHCFAATILDRVYLLRGEFDHFQLSIHGRELLQRRIDIGKGCILLGSHLGSFEVLRALGVTKEHFALKVLMDTAHNQNITDLLDALNPEIASTVIAPDRPDTLLRVKESLDTGSVVGMLGDRISIGEKTAQCQFLGAPATFPALPILLAAMMHCPVVLFFGLYRGGKCYEIYFEDFAQEIILNREQRAQDIQQWTQRYAARLEHYAHLAPYNWFNFYPFWDHPGRV